MGREGGGLKWGGRGGGLKRGGRGGGVRPDPPPSSFGPPYGPRRRGGEKF